MNGFCRKMITCLGCLLITIPVPISVTEAQETTVVTRGDLEIVTNLPGIFVADDKDEIKLEPRKYSGDLIVTKILQEGIDIKKGDVLIEFDTDLLDEAIEEAQNEATDADVELQKATAEFESAKIDLEAKQFQLQAELKVLQLEVEAAIEKQSTALEEKQESISDAEYSLANARIDMDTLQKIYLERKLETSNSGDILLEREKAEIANGEKRIEFLKKELDYFRMFDQTKDQLEKELKVDKKQAEIKKEKILLEAAVAEKNSVVEKAQRKMDAATSKVKDLQDDREELRVVSPRDGVLFYGTTGQEMPAGIVIFGGGNTNIRDELRIGGRVQTHKVLMTVAKMEQLSIKMSVSEEDIQHLQRGQAITVYPDAFPSSNFAGTLTDVDQIATKVNFTSSEQRFKVMGKCTDIATQLRSGMNCRVAIHNEPIKEAILVPVNCVFAVDGDYVCFVQSGGKFEKRKVELGFSNADLVQVLSGLSPDEVVSLAKPSSD